MQHPKPRGGCTGSSLKIKTSGANRENGPSRGLATRSPKAIDQRLQRGQTSEKKRVGRVPELELKLVQLQEDLEKTKERLRESELGTKRAHQEAEEAKKQLDDFWAGEESRIQELRKISQDRDRAWESELKAVQKHLIAILNENQKLKIQLEKVVESEAARAKHAESAHDEVATLRLELSETVEVVEELKIRLNETKDSESRALELVTQTREQLEIVKASIEKDENGEEERLVELGSALAANAEMESELRRLKVQTEQWRKAAEVAAAMVLGDGDGGGGGGGKFFEPPESFDFHVVGEKSNSPPYSEDTEDESLNKKTSNMLKKLGVLLKKGQK